MGQIASFIVPGFVAADYYNLGYEQSIANTFPTAIKNIGGNYVAIQDEFQVANYISPTFNNFTLATTGSGDSSSHSFLSDAEVLATTQATHAAGLKVCYKPHVTSYAQNHGQGPLLPGAYTPSGSSVGIIDAEYTASQTILYSPTASFANSLVGDRIISFQSSDIPGSLNGQPYGTTAAINATVTGVTDANHLIISVPFANSQSGSGPLIFIIDEPSLVFYFANYQAILDHRLTIAAAGGGIDMLNIDTEHQYLHACAPTYYRALIAHYRNLYPNMQLILGMFPGNRYDTVSFWDALDYLGMDWYATVMSSGGGDSLSTVQANWAPYLSTLSAWSQAWGNKQVLFPEIGYRSVVATGYDPATSSGGTPAYADQTTCITAFLNKCWNQSWFAGFHYWEWDRAIAGDTVYATTSYSPNYKTAYTAFQKFFAANSPPPFATTWNSNTPQLVSINSINS